MATNGGSLRRRRRRPLPLRAKLAIGAFAGVAAAWLIPKGGVPPPVTTPTPSAPRQVTAVQEPLSAVPAGVSFKTLDGVRVFLVRTGGTVTGFEGRATTATGGPVYWCPSAGDFQSTDLQTRYDRTGKALHGFAERDLNRVHVLVNAGHVTIFPHQITPGPAIDGSLPVLDSSPCAANERVG